MSINNFKQYIAEWDPVGLLEDPDVPRDEYDREAYEIRWWYKSHPEATPEEVEKYIHEVFQEWIGKLTQEFLEDCHRRMPGIMSALKNDLELGQKSEQKRRNI